MIDEDTIINYLFFAFFIWIFLLMLLLLLSSESILVKLIGISPLVVSLILIIYVLPDIMKKPIRNQTPIIRFGRIRLSRRYRTLPEECPICKTPLTPENIHWIDEERLECLKCGYLMKVRKKKSKKSRKKQSNKKKN